MPDNYRKLMDTLKELFQLDSADLDFGIYRIMNQKREEITNFLEDDLLPQVRRTLEEYQSSNVESLREELNRVTQSVTDAGMNPEDAPRVKELRAQMAQYDLSATEDEVFSHLASFFRRYYKDGDFLSLRRYKADVYAIPYEGEEVKLHWANADQYYVKSTEYFRDYTFRLPSGRRVHFKLADADTERDNNKAQQGKERHFVLAETDPVEDQGELVIHFEYRPDDLKQDALNAAAVQAILGKAGIANWTPELRTPAPTEKNPARTLLEKHLTDYTKRNESDYFIHKDLGKFLRRELDFYIKNEVVHLDDIEDATAPQVEQYLSRVKAIRRIGHKIITFLAQLEDFQKKLWLKKKFVVDTHYCVTLSCIPHEFYPEIAANKAQRAEWTRLYGDWANLDQGDGTASAQGKLFAGDDVLVTLSPNFRAPGTCMIDTTHFSPEFTDRLLGTIEDLDEQTDGVLFHSENFQALSLMQTRYREQVKCIYIDPPYNTGGDGFAYKDSYQHSSWLCMIFDRLLMGATYLSEDGAVFASIDEVEQPNMRLVMDSIFGRGNHVADMVWAAGRKNDSRLVSVSHEYIVAYARSRDFLSTQNVQWRQRKKGLDDIYAQYTRLKRQHGTDYVAMTDGLKAWFRDLPDGHPAKVHRHYNHVDARGVYFPADISWPGGGGPRFEVLHPKTKKPVRVPSRGWMTSDPAKMQKWIDQGMVHFGKDESAVPCIKSYLEDREHQAPYSVFYQDGRAATKRLRDVLGADDFGYPKDETVIGELVEMLTGREDVILDYFAGSGTTGHAVINLNREDGGRRKCILVEMGEYFDTVLLPRMKKVTFTPEWKDGKPKRLPTPEEVDRSPRIIKYLRLESFEDTLNNLALKSASKLLFGEDVPAGVREEYMLSYMMDLESRGSASLLNVDAFANPFSYTLNIATGSAGETRPVNVDLVETFNYLIGLRVKTMDTIRGFRVVTGANPAGEKVLIIWRTLPSAAWEADYNEVSATPAAGATDTRLERFLEKLGITTRDQEYDLIYVNGDNNLENLRRPDETWKVRLIEEEFQRLMFDVQDV